MPDITIKTIITILTVSLLHFLFIIMYLKKDSKYDFEKKIIKLPTIYFVIGLAFSLTVGIILSLMIINGKKLWWEYIIVFSLFLIGLSIVIASVNWRMILFRDTVIYRTFFRKTYTFQYKDIEKYIRTENIAFFKVKRKWFMIDPELPDIDCFLNRIRIKPRK